MGPRNPIYASRDAIDSVVDKIDQLRKILDERHNDLREDLAEKHLQNRSDIKFLRNELQKVLDRIQVLEQEIAIALGSDTRPGLVTRIDLALQEFIGKTNIRIEKIEGTIHTYELKWAKIVGWVSCLGFLSAGLFELIKWIVEKH